MTKYIVKIIALNADKIVLIHMDKPNLPKMAIPYTLE